MNNFAIDSHSNNKMRRMKSKQEFFFFLGKTRPSSLNDWTVWTRKLLRMGARDSTPKVWETLSPSFTYMDVSLKQSYETPVKKNLMRITLLRTYECLKLYFILYIFCSVIIFYIYQTMHSLSNNFKSLLSKFCKYLKYNSEDKAVSGVFFDSYFDR